MKVLFVIYGLAPAGPELRLLEFARRFPPTIEMHVCVIGDELTLLEPLRSAGARVVIIPIRRPYRQWGQVRKALAYVRDHEIAVINSFDLKTLLVALAAKLCLRRPPRLVHHLVHLWDGVREYQKRILWRAMSYADLVLCNGYAVRDLVIGSREFRPPVVVVPNGVDCEVFRPSRTMRLAERARSGIAAEHFVLGTVANVRSVKNYPLLLNTFRRIAEKHAHARLVCVGGGPQLEEMQQLARELGLGDRVVFTGPVHDVRPWLATFDAFALCSFKEGCPNALMQAMAMGVASIGSSVGEVPRLMDDGRCGLLFEPTDGEAFHAAVTRLIEDPDLCGRLAAAGRARMEELYASPRMIASYVAVFDGATSEPPPSPKRATAADPRPGLR